MKIRLLPSSNVALGHWAATSTTGRSKPFDQIKTPQAIAPASGDGVADLLVCGAWPVLSLNGWMSSIQQSGIIFIGAFESAVAAIRAGVLSEQTLAGSLAVAQLPPSRSNEHHSGYLQT